MFKSYQTKKRDVVAVLFDGSHKALGSISVALESITPKLHWEYTLKVFTRQGTYEKTQRGSILLMPNGDETTPSEMIEINEGDYVVLDDGWSVLTSEEFELVYEQRSDPLISHLESNFVAIPGKING